MDYNNTKKTTFKWQWDILRSSKYLKILILILTLFLASCRTMSSKEIQAISCKCNDTITQEDKRLPIPPTEIVKNDSIESYTTGYGNPYVKYIHYLKTNLQKMIYYDAQGKSPHVDSLYYDEKGRINRIDQYMILSGEIPEKLPLDTRLRYTYDEKGRLHERFLYYGYALDNPAGKKEFIYDTNGNNTIIRTYLLSIGTTVDMKYIYNEKNQLIKSGYPSDSDPEKIVSNIKTYEYDENGNRIKENSFSEEPNSKLNGYVQYNYDGMELMDMLITDVDEKNGQRKHIAEYIEQASVISYRRTTVAIRLVAHP